MPADTWYIYCMVTVVTGQFADNKLAVSQISDWLTHRLVKSPICLMENLQ